MTALLIGSLIMGGIGLLGGISSSIISSNQARADAEAQKKYTEDMYKLNKARAEEEYAAAKEQADRNATQAEKEADLADKSLDVTEQGLSNDFNTTIDQMYLGQTADAMQWNAQSMQMGSEEGAAYANIAGSGVRAGSSLSDAVDMESATNEAQLQFSQDAKRRSDSNNLASVLNDLAGNRFNIEKNRIGADVQRQEAAYLRNSYLEGGHNYNLYQNQLDTLKTTSDYNSAQLQTQINRNSFIGGDGSAWFRLGSSAISGGVKGFTTGYNLMTTYKKAKTPTFGEN